MRELIDRYGLLPHPEGGYYREIHRSAQKVTSPVADAERSALTHIYFLLTQGQISRFHRVRHDEIWNFYEGFPLRLVTFDGSTVEEQLLSPAGYYTGIIRGGLFQAAETMGEYSLVGCSVAPGFDFADFDFLADTAELVGALEKHAPSYRRLL